jgi:hypothetical protein
VLLHHLKEVGRTKEYMTMATQDRRPSRSTHHWDRAVHRLSVSILLIVQIRFRIGRKNEGPPSVALVDIVGTRKLPKADSHEFKG